MKRAQGVMPLEKNGRENEESSKSYRAGKWVFEDLRKNSE
jgi:hypothetical protein